MKQCKLQPTCVDNNFTADSVEKSSPMLMELNNSIVSLLYAHTYGRSAQALFYGGAEIFVYGIRFYHCKKGGRKMKSHVKRNAESNSIKRHYNGLQQ